MPMNQKQEADWLRTAAGRMSDTDLAAAISNWETTQCEAGAGKARANATRVLGYLRREAKRRWYS